MNKEYNEKVKVVYIAPDLPIPNSQHAGGQSAFYVTNKMKNDTHISLRLICWQTSNDRKQFDLFTKQGFDGVGFTFSGESYLRYFLNRVSSKTFGYIHRSCYDKVIEIAKEWKIEGYVPDYVVFDWERSCCLYNALHKIWPTCKFNVVLKDVSYQSYQRYYKSAKTLKRKLSDGLNYIQCRRADKKIFPHLNEIIVLNKKDQDLVMGLNLGIDRNRVRIIVPFYHSGVTLPIEEPKENLAVFMGYMTRKDNQEAVEWFITNVLPRIPNLKFVVIGGGVPDYLKKYESNQVHFTGFVDYNIIEEYYTKALCAVIPLFHGAGIKIKVIEAMSAGVPVLTNEIGIEGINAEKNKEYYYCETAEEYICKLNELIKNKNLRITIGKAARIFTQRAFNFENSTYVHFDNK